MIAKKITIHCSATPNSRDVSSETINKWHTETNGWRSIGYHYVIKRNGDVDSRLNKHYFRGLNEQGAHVRGNNKNNIGICVIGMNKFTLEQFHSLWDTINDLQLTYNILDSEIFCHNEFNHNKTCPNMRAANLVAWLTTGEVKHIKSYIYKETMWLKNK